MAVQHRARTIHVIVRLAAIATTAAVVMKATVRLEDRISII